ncbi:lytic transglycosylase domain-containing protein [Sphingomonas sp. LaA6.9]|uniref:lytic murein transglycosylase n=1 Tax=Sphingomonas sp. LaA6.9 TaxID=2919914 RepID=UPI001F501773|nr:lytic murein transglycosylase [Sphingomonas sp. LaA6.9]MCJ8158545.1 lytic murein transglycosylase [Sphingomonas sp. LaA6.9]
MRYFLFSAALLVSAAVPQSSNLVVTPALAQSEDGFQSFLSGLRGQAERQGISRRTLDGVLPTLTFNPRVIELDRAQPGGAANSPIPAFAPYKARHVDAARINRGRAKYQQLRGNLSRIERETGVPEAIMVAIYGHETNYGSYTGDFDLLRALASLAYEGRRRELFTSEFLSALKMIDQGVPRSRLVGSWAGATGYPQFLPSIYLRLAKDGDGDGRKDIWTSESDALASIANYFVNAGWRPNVPWGVAASVPSTLDRSAIRSKLVSPRCARVHDRHSQWKTIAEWKALGVRPTGYPVPRDSELASLLEPDGPGQTAYLLTGNYRVILDYNCSNFYALSVGLLADEVAR